MLCARCFNDYRSDALQPVFGELPKVRVCRACTFEIKRAVGFLGWHGVRLVFPDGTYRSWDESHEGTMSESLRHHEVEAAATPLPPKLSSTPLQPKPSANSTSSSSSKTRNTVREH